LISGAKTARIFRKETQMKKKINSQADVMADWEDLLQAVQNDAEVQPSVAAESQSLAQLLTQLQGLKARQNELRGLRQEVTQQLKATVVEGSEMAIKVRSVVKGKVGPKNERLVRFKISPLRKRPRKPKDKQPAGGAPEPNPVPSAAPSGKSAA
jgi:DNA repair ATPase RecN